LWLWVYWFENINKKVLNFPVYLVWGVFDFFSESSEQFGPTYRIQIMDGRKNGTTYEYNGEVFQRAWKGDSIIEDGDGDN